MPFQGYYTIFRWHYFSLKVIHATVILSGNTYSIITADSFTGDHYLEATRKDHNFIVDDDDVRDNYIDGVSEVKFTLKDGGRKINEYDYSKYSKKPTKGETQKLIQQKE